MTDEVTYGMQIQLLAAAHPDEVAVTFAAEHGGERTVTWWELHRRSTQLAHVLWDRGVVVGDRLAICLRNSPEHLIACFAAWKVGATVIPMRWGLPEWERGRLLDTIAPRLVVGDGVHSDLFEESSEASRPRVKSCPTSPIDAAGAAQCGNR